MPFNAILQQDIESKFARNCRARQIHSQTVVCERRRDRPAAALLLGYARVSKGDEQNNALQTKALKAAGCRRLFEEAASGGRWDRPELHRLLDHLREGDTVVVWKLDRLSRSLKDVLHIMERIGNAGAGFRSITENIDTTTPAGRMMMQMVGAFAEFERAMIRERTSAGLAAARAEGRIGGRRKKARCRQAPRDRRKRHHRPQVRRRDGAALQHQPANRVADRRPAQDGAAIVAQECTRGAAYACPQEATSEGHVDSATAKDEDCCG